MKHEELVNAVKNAENSKETGAASAIKAFAVLLGTLAEDSDESAQVNIRLQKEVRDLTEDLRNMTWWLKFLTIILLVVGFVSMYPSVKVVYNDITSSFHTGSGSPETNAGDQE